MQDRRKVIRPLVLREAMLLNSKQRAKETEQLLRTLTNNCTRDTVFECALELLEEDQQRKAAIGSFFLYFLPSFPPSRETTIKIREKGRLLMGENSSCSDIYQQLDSILTEYTRPDRYFLLFSFNDASYGQSFDEHFQNPNYLSKFGLQLRVGHREKTPVKFFQWSKAQIANASQLKNKNKKHPKETDLSFTRSKDYISQFPLECPEGVVNQQLVILADFSENYKSNVSVLRASNFIIKQICDGYVSKLPFGKPYSLFRTISICYLPTLFSMMESDYLCVRSHVYDLLLTLGVHLQFVDTENKYDCTEALENELVWILFTVLKRQAVIMTQDELIWTAAAKCVLAVVPRHFRHLIDSRALLQFLHIPKLAELHPGAFTAFTEAFVRSLLADKRFGIKPQDNLNIDKEAFDSLGSSGIGEIIDLYRKASTVGARFSLFQFLFAYAAQRIKKLPKESKTIGLPQLLQHCFKELVSLELFWYLHSLLFYQSRRVVMEMANEIIYDLNFKEMRESRAVIMMMVQELLQVIEDDTALPNNITQSFDDIKQNSNSTSRLVVMAEDVVGTVPLLLKEASIDAKMYKIAWRLAFYTLQITGERLSPELHRPLSHKLISQIIDYDEVTDEQVKYRIRKVFPDLLYSLALLCRMHPLQYLTSLGDLTEGVLFSKKASLRNFLPQLVSFHQRTLELFSLRNGSIFHSPEKYGISHLIIKGTLSIPLSACESAGSRNLWAMYRALVQEQAQTVRDNRFIIVSMIAALEQSTELRCVRAWETVLADPYPPVALIGALRIVQIYKKYSSRTFEDVNERSENLYEFAVNLVENHSCVSGATS